MLTDEIAFALAPFFDKIGPSHDEISLLVRRSGFGEYDPGRPGDQQGPGKMKRVRTILIRAAGDRRRQVEPLIRAFVDSLRSHGSFDRSSADFPGEARFIALQNAFRAQGYDLARDGQLTRLSLDALEGVELTDALSAYADRSLRGSEDIALLVGTGKDLLEATAKHVIEVASGAPASSTHFDATLFQAFDRLGMATPPADLVGKLDRDPRRMLEQALWLAAIAQKKLRNELGTGHGHASLPLASLDDARLSSQTAGLVSRMLLDRATTRHARHAA